MHDHRPPPAPAAEPTEEQKLASDRAYNILKNSGALDALATLNAMRLDLRHGVGQ